MKMALRPRRPATRPAVPVPLKGSRMVPPGGHPAKIHGSTSFVGKGSKVDVRKRCSRHLPNRSPVARDCLSGHTRPYTIVGAQNGAFHCTPNDPNCTPPTIVGEILQVDLFSAIVATRWHKQNLAQDEFQVEILAMTPLRQSEDIPMSQLLAE